MSKVLILAATISGLGGVAIAAPLAGDAFNPGQVEVVWSVSPASIPPAVWHYKNVPQSFSPAVISNLMALGDFRPSDAVKGFSWAVAAAIRFENPNKTRRLTILPAEGWVEYDNQEVRTGLKGPIEEVPDEAQAFRLGLLYLHKVGVDRSQLATKYGSSDLLVFATKRERGRVASTHRAGSPEVLSRGVSFVRRSDGAAFTGTGPAGGFSVEFGNHARVAHLELVWRNREPWQSCPVDSAPWMKQWKR